MKKKLVKFSAILFFVFGFILSETKAQTVSTPNYQIRNNRNCAVKVFYELGCPSYGSGTITIGPGGASVFVPTTVGGDIMVQVLEIGGVSVGVASTFAVYGSCWGTQLSTFTGVPLIVPPMCRTNPNYGLNWSPAITVIN